MGKSKQQPRYMEGLEEGTALAGQQVRQLRKGQRGTVGNWKLESAKFFFEDKQYHGQLRLQPILGDFSKDCGRGRVGSDHGQP